MALTPALEMSFELPTERKALPILKVLYRNTDRIQQFGGSSSEVLRRIDAIKHEGKRVTGKKLQKLTRKADVEGAEAPGHGCAGCGGRGAVHRRRAAVVRLLRRCAGAEVVAGVRGTDCQIFIDNYL